jgi:hypothetical protein
VISSQSSMLDPLETVENNKQIHSQHLHIHHVTSIKIHLLEA